MDSTERGVLVSRYEACNFRKGIVSKDRNSKTAVQYNLSTYGGEKKTPELLEQTKTFLMLPDYFQFLLTGRMVSEYTNGTSTQLVNPTDKQWDMDLIEKIGFPKDIFLPIQMPGVKVGNLTEDIFISSVENCQSIANCKVL